jgi:hypothetical protein
MVQFTLPANSKVRPGQVRRVQPEPRVPNVFASTGGTPTRAAIRGSIHSHWISIDADQWFSAP